MTIIDQTPAGAANAAAEQHAGAANGHADPADLAVARDPGARPLLPQHQRVLRDRAVSEALWREVGYRSAEWGEDVRALSFGSLPTPGLIIPVHPPAGLRAGDEPAFAYRPDRPTNPKRKYEWLPGVPQRLDSPPPCHTALRDKTVTLYVTEGWLKAAALASVGLCAVALIGTACFGFRPEPEMPILRDWEAIALAGRLVRVVFDSDADRNSNVARDRLRLTALLEERGARVGWTHLPAAAGGAKQGVDDWLAAGGTPEALEALVTPPTQNPLLGATRDDSGNSDRFVYEHAEQAAWVPQRKVWAVWGGRHWDFSNPEQVLALGKETARSYQIAAARLPNEHPEREAIKEHAGKLGGRYGINAMLDLARPDLSVPVDAFDTDPWLLNVLNGTVDLRTGALRPHDPRDLIDKVSPVEFDPAARSDDWDQFLALFTSGDAALATHLQRVAGYCLTGVAREGSLFFLLGKTRTGKTTFVNALKGTLGDYGWKAAFDTFLVGRRPGAVRSDVAAMRGKRLVVASEVTSGQRLDEAVVKELTGEDDVSARDLYAREGNFRPVSKLILAANDFPHVRSDDGGTWARLNLVRCEGEQLQERVWLPLKQRVMDVGLTGPAILAWAVQGCLDWQRDDDLARPPSVDQAVAAQREEFQPLRDFVAEHCETGAGFSAAFAALRVTYVSWAKAMGEQHPVGPKRFSQELAAMGFEPYRSDERRFRGVQLRRLAGGMVEEQQ